MQPLPVFLNESLLLFPGSVVSAADAMLCLLNCYHHIPWFNLRCVNKASGMHIQLLDNLSEHWGNMNRLVPEQPFLRNLNSPQYSLS